MLEFALLAPVFAALLTGFASVGITFVRTSQADQLCRQATQMAVGGVDFSREQAQEELFNLFGGNLLQERRGALYLTHIVRNGDGYSSDKSYRFGNTVLWHSDGFSDGRPIHLEAGEDAWIGEVWLENETIVSSITPKEVHARVVR